MNSMNFSHYPPTKKRRIQGKQTNLNDLFRNMDEIQEATNNIQAQMTILQAQMESLSDALAETKNLITKCVRQNYDDDNLLETFPIQTNEKLIQFENKLNSDNRKHYIHVMRGLLEPAGVQKNLRYILGDDVIMAYNVEGVQGKKSFKELKQFFSVLLEAVSMTNVNSIGFADEHLRKALQMQKRRIFKNQSLERKALKQLYKKE